MDSDQLNPQSPPKLQTYVHPEEDEIDLRELLGIIWAERFLILGVTAIVAVSSVFYALSLTNIYRAEASIVAANVEQSAGGLASQFGGAAALLGVNLGSSQGNSVSNALAVLTSREFIGRFIDEHNVMVPLFAGRWDPVTRQSLVDPTIYDVESERWMSENGAPTAQEAYRAFRGMLTVSSPERDTGIVMISIQSPDPSLASFWVNQLVADINRDFKARDIAEATNAVAYLQRQLESTQLVDMRAVLFDLIESQTRITMLADVREEYVFQVIDPAIEPDQKIAPRRSIICITWTLLGGVCSFLLIFLRRALKYFRKS